MLTVFFWREFVCFGEQQEGTIGYVGVTIYKSGLTKKRILFSQPWQFILLLLQYNS